MKITNDERTLNVTEKAFNVIYKHRGFKEVKENSDSLESLTVSELKEIAKQHEIEGYSSMKKDELMEVVSRVL